MASASGFGRAPAMMFGPGEANLAQELLMPSAVPEEEEGGLDSMPNSPPYDWNSLWSPTSQFSAVAANPMVSPLVSPFRRSDQIVLPSELTAGRLAGEARAADAKFRFRSRAELEYSLAEAERQVQRLGLENACLRQRLRSAVSKPESVDTFLEELSRQRHLSSQGIATGTKVARPAQDLSLKLDRKFEEFCKRSQASSSAGSPPQKVAGSDNGCSSEHRPPEPTEDASSSTSRFHRTAGPAHEAEVRPWVTPPTRQRGAGNDLSGQAAVEGGPEASAGRDSSILALSPDSDCVSPPSRSRQAGGDARQHDSPPLRRASGYGCTPYDNLQQISKGSADGQTHDCRPFASNIHTTSTSVNGPQALDIAEASALPAVLILNELPPTCQPASDCSQHTLQQQEASSQPPRRQILLLGQTWPLKRSSSSPAVASLGLIAGARQRHRSSSPPPSCRLVATQQPLLWLPVSPAL
eukprot:TRINITY_DN27052_c0_g1_i1.p1 TRINITY_DN27052_c0_g1~~TRINITY_DN27052_c0_g1_i1.p1  ORF type:complete len:489 (+),score=70.83 TRINITY_DN27052_c0_g1_i1:65-1468(+)